MENTASKTENLQPMLLKVGVSIALSAAGSICAILMARTAFKASLFEPESRFRAKESSLIQEDEPNYKTEEVIIGLRRRVEDIERKEMEVERQFTLYQDLKERETLLVEVRNSLFVDMAHINFLEREILSMEEENKRFESLVLEYLRVSEQLECQKSENKLLEREEKQVKKKLKEQSRVIREKDLKIEETKSQLWRNNDEMETKKNLIEKLESKVRDLQMQLNHFHHSSKSKIEAERSIIIEDYNKLANEIKQLKDACSQHGLLRNDEQNEQNEKDYNHQKALECEGNKEEKGHGLKQEINGKALEQNEHLSDKTGSLTRRKFLQKISCVGSNEKMRGKIRPEKEV